MSLKAMSDYTFVSRYARYLPEKKRRETWDEAVERVKSMHLSYYKDANIEEDINWAFDQVKQKKILGSQRALQFGGEPLLKKHARNYNCSFSYCDRLKFFQESMWMLLCGVGVGFSVQKHHVNKLPEFNVLWSMHEKQTFVIPDSIEGWADAIGILISSYFVEDVPFPEYSNGRYIEFDYSQIRPKGSPLSNNVGKAPGPDGLRNSIEKIRTLLQNCIKRGQAKLRPINAYDIVMHSSDAVLSGGVRRSATLCIFSPDDQEMVEAKIGDWESENLQRARSNNSALLVRDKTSKEDFKKIMESTKEHGEPGFIWADDTESGYNPCVEINLYAYDEDGNSGWQVCNLCEINGKKIKTKEDFYDACKAAAIIGTLQAGYTDFEYLGEVSEKIIRREALLGVSITGLMDSPDILLSPGIQRNGAKIVRETNELFAGAIGINPAARTTCVKPAGSTSLILGTASGIHPHHARRYFRRIQANKMEAPIQHFQMGNPTAIEKSVWSANNTDYVVTFCVEVPDGTKLKNQLSAIELLEMVKLTKKNWVDHGVREGQSVKPWLSHNVSNTINVRDDEWDQVAEFIYKNKDSFAGISLLPIAGDKDYAQAPNCTVYTPHEIVKEYGDASVFASGIIEIALKAFDGNLWEACDVLLDKKQLSMENGGLKAINGDSANFAIAANEHKNISDKLTWLERAKCFAEKYFDGDTKRMTYCLKDISNWYVWVNLNKSYIEIDYTSLIEHEDNTKLEEELACAGGACEVAL